MTAAWLLQMARWESACEGVSVGGLARTLGLLEPMLQPDAADRSVLGKLFELARRRAGFGVDELARQAAIDVRVILALESGSRAVPEPDSIQVLCQILDLPVTGVMALLTAKAGTGNRVAEAMAGFLDTSSHAGPLSPAETVALDSLLKALARG